MNIKDNSWVLLIFAGAAALALGMGIGRFAYTPILPFMIEELGLTAADGGLIASWNFVGYCVGSLLPIFSVFARNLKSWFFCSVFLSIISTAAMGLVTDLNWFILIRILSGISSAFILIFGTSLILPSVQELGRVSTSTTHLMGVGIGIVLSSIAVSVMGHLGFLWDELLFGTALLALFLAIPVFILTPADSRKKEGNTRKTTSGYNMGFILITMGYGLFGFGYVILATFVSTMARTVSELSSTEPYIWLLVGLAGIPSVIIWPWLGRIIGNDRALALACTFEAIGVFVSAAETSQLGIIVGSIILGATFMGITALAFLEGQNRFNGPVIASTAILTSSFSLGQVLGPYSAGLIIHATGNFHTVMSVSTAALVIAAFLMLDPKRIISLTRTR
ncbi:MAG: YbfB/YjiJ family MFS transporter [Pseudomonadota bacterium]|nr:YbfB/YjiJ family MFS transporter [Pseudomonadota bacterium]